MRSRPVLVSVLVSSLLLSVGLLFVNLCADGGAMGSAYRTCDCRGLEWEAYDRTAADGPRRTLCFGHVASITCYQNRDGAEVPCAR